MTISTIVALTIFALVSFTGIYYNKNQSKLIKEILAENIELKRFVNLMFKLADEQNETVNKFRNINMNWGEKWKLVKNLLIDFIELYKTHLCCWNYSAFQIDRELIDNIVTKTLKNNKDVEDE